MKSKIIKWYPLNITNNYIYIKAIIDDFDGLTVILENDASNLLTIKWKGTIESYCSSTEEARYKFISGEWQDVRKEFPDWPFFKVVDSPYVNWVREQAGGFMDNDLIHFMIVSSDYVLDIVSLHEPDECYEN